MADAVQDGPYAQSLRAIAERGRTGVETGLFNGEYFIQKPDPAHPNTAGTFGGCPIEQLMGQNWAYEVGLGDIVDRQKALTALNAMWKYDYTTDVGPYRAVFKKGRSLADPGEGGLILCTFPQGGDETVTKTSAGFYWNECECGSHYSRSMASYGVFVAACGFEYDGPQSSMTFAPRVGPENFRAAFTAAEGWGIFAQSYEGTGLRATVTLRYGTLRLKTLNLNLPAGSQARRVVVLANGKDLAASLIGFGDRVQITFPSELVLVAGEAVHITIQ